MFLLRSCVLLWTYHSIDILYTAVLSYNTWNIIDTITFEPTFIWHTEYEIGIFLDNQTQWQSARCRLHDARKKRRTKKPNKRNTNIIWKYSRNEPVFCNIFSCLAQIPVFSSHPHVLSSCNAECDQTFVSRPGGPQNGTFTAPLLFNPMNHSRQCLYIFLAGPGQRVEVLFTNFNLRGTPQE